MSRQPAAPTRKRPATPSYNRRDENPGMYSTRGACARMGITPTTLMKLVAAGDIRCYRIGERPLLKFDRDEIESYISQQMSA